MSQLPARSLHLLGDKSTVRVSGFREGVFSSGRSDPEFCEHSLVLPIAGATIADFFQGLEVGFWFLTRVVRGEGTWAMLGEKRPGILSFFAVVDCWCRHCEFLCRFGGRV